MKRAVLWMMLAALALPLGACGHKGNLKSPAQIELNEQKEAKRQAKEAQQQQKDQQKALQKQQQQPQDVPLQDQPYPRTNTGN